MSVLFSPSDVVVPSSSSSSSPGEERKERRSLKEEEEDGGGGRGPFLHPPSLPTWFEEGLEGEGGKQGREGD